MDDATQQSSTVKGGTVQTTTVTTKVLTPEERIEADRKNAEIARSQMPKEDKPADGPVATTNIQPDFSSGKVPDDAALNPGGPDTRTSQPKPGQRTIQTSMGVLDHDDVMHNRVGGTGVVHVHQAAHAEEKEPKSK